MSEKPRGSSPNTRRRIVTDEANEANARAQKAFQRRNQKNQSFFTQYGYHIVIGGFLALVLIAFGNTLFSKSRNPDVTPVIEDDEISSHNSRGYSFQLGSNQQFDQWMLSDAKNSLNVQISSRQNLSKCASAESSSIIPDSYNFREQFPRCVEGKEVYSQGKCSTSYATTVASTISDRICQQSKETEIINLSPQPLLTCDSGFTLGCQGGYISRGFDYAKKHGLPENSCFQYTESDKANCEEQVNCQKHKIADQCVATEEQGIKREIFLNGPVVAVLPVHRDFLVYKSGIYEIIDGVSSFRSGQAIKIIGWGKEESSGRNFWIVENSWGASWGENGLARIYTKQALHIDDLAIAPILNIASTQDSANATQEQN